MGYMQRLVMDSHALIYFSGKTKGMYKDGMHEDGMYEDGMYIELIE
ncbi:hypothetical protein MY4038_009279 [Beauveria bassiana]